MRFRTPEIFLGAFLAVAIFAMGILFASSQKPTGVDQQVGAPKTTDQTQQPKAPDSELTGSSWLTKDAAGFFTFVLVIVGGIQAGFFWVQLRLIRTSLLDAKIAAIAAERAARATEDAVELSRLTAQRQLRAYVIVDGDTFDIKPGKFISKLKVINTGVTPAYEMKVISKTDILPLPLPGGFNFGIEDPGNPSITILGRDRDVGHASDIDAGEVPRQKFEAALADNSSEVIYTYGVATYRDAFGIPQHTNFCFYYAWKKDSVTCHVSEYHNDAS